MVGTAFRGRQVQHEDPPRSGEWVHTYTDSEERHVAACGGIARLWIDGRIVRG